MEAGIVGEDTKQGGACGEEGGKVSSSIQNRKYLQGCQMLNKIGS